MAPARLPSAERLRELFEYNPETGILVWRSTGNRAGTPLSITGYLRVYVDARYYLVHRIAWTMVKGIEPAKNIDHINGVVSDNRLANLREATQRQNSMNRRVRVDNKLGLKGVCIERSAAGTIRYLVQVNGKKVGRFKTKEAAKQAYDAAARSQNGEFFRSQ